MATQEQVEKLLKLNLQNIIKKLKDGKTLTQRESDLLEQEKEKSSGEGIVEYAKTITELSSILNVPRKTIYEWRSKPGAPSAEKNKIPVKEWIEWASLYTRAKGTGGESLNALTLEYKLEQVRNLKIKNEQLLGDLIARQVVIEVIEALAFLVREEVLKSGMSDEAKQGLFEKLNKKQNESITGIIEKNRAVMDNAGENDGSAVGRAAQVS
jgi:hypothetical protein